MRFLLSLILLLPSMALAQLATLNAYVDWEGGTVGNQLTTTILNNGTHGSGGTWSITPSSSTRLFVTNVGETIIRAPIVVAGTAYDDVGSTKTLSASMGTANQYCTYTFTASQPKISVGFYVRFDPFPVLGSSYDIVEIECGGEFIVLNYDDSSGNGTRFRNHTQNGTAELAQVTSNTVYWVTIKHDKNAGTSGTSEMRIYNPTTWLQLGSNTFTHSQRLNAESISFGRYDNHTVDATDSTHVYYDDFMLDLSGSVFPLLPAGGTIAAASLSVANFTTAYTSAVNRQGTNRDIIALPTGTLTVSSPYTTIQKTVVIKGNGTNNTKITLSGFGGEIPLLKVQAPFVTISNIYCMGSAETGVFVYPQSNQCRVCYCLIGNLEAGIWAKNFGCADHNVFYDGSKWGRNIFSENQVILYNSYYPQAWDSTNWWVWEYNDFHVTAAKVTTGTINCMSSQQSDLWVFRHNNIFLTNASCNFGPVLDFHGNDPGLVYPGLGLQVYSNRVFSSHTGGNTTAFVDLRGTRALLYNNQMFGTVSGNGVRAREESASTSPNQHVTATYVWENYDTDGTVPMLVGVESGSETTITAADFHTTALVPLLAPPFPDLLQELPSTPPGGGNTPPTSVRYGSGISGLRLTR